MRRSKQHPYSITSSARANRAAGISMPIVLAVCVLRLYPFSHPQFHGIR
jgi:hypothetical protein